MAFIKLLVLAIISIVMLVLAGLVYDWLRNKLGIKPTPPTLPTLEQLLPQLMPTYISVGYALTKCVNSSGTCGLLPIRHYENIHVPLDERVRGTPQKLVFIYEFQRNVVGPFNIQTSSWNYNTIPVKKIADILNRSLESHCIFNGCPPVKIVAGKSYKDGRVRLAVAEPPANF